MIRFLVCIVACAAYPATVHTQTYTYPSTSAYADPGQVPAAYGPLPPVSTNYGAQATPFGLSEPAVPAQPTPFRLPVHYEPHPHRLPSPHSPQPAHSATQPPSDPPYPTTPHPAHDDWGYPLPDYPIGGLDSDRSDSSELDLSHLPPSSILPPPETELESAEDISDALVLPVEEDEWTFYEFFDPRYWFPAPAWSGSVDLGLNGSTGNTESFSMKSGGKLRRKTETSIFAFDVAYVKTNTNSLLTQHNAIANAKAERLFPDSPWTTFTKFYTEYDEMRAFDVRLALNAGVGYRWWDTEAVKLTTRFGAGWSREFGGPADRFVPEALFGVDFERQISKRQSLRFASDYFPDWGDFANYRIVTDASWQILLDEEHNLSLKISAVDRYDSTPNGQRPNDLNYSVLLHWEL